MLSSDELNEWEPIYQLTILYSTVNPLSFINNWFDRVLFEFKFTECACVWICSSVIFNWNLCTWVVAIQFIHLNNFCIFTLLCFIHTPSSHCVVWIPHYRACTQSIRFINSIDIFPSHLNAVLYILYSLITNTNFFVSNKD